MPSRIRETRIKNQDSRIKDPGSWLLNPCSWFPFSTYSSRSGLVLASPLPFLLLNLNILLFQKCSPVFMRALNARIQLKPDN